jgi:hypothetical protein
MVLSNDVHGTFSHLLEPARACALWPRLPDFGMRPECEPMVGAGRRAELVDRRLRQPLEEIEVDRRPAQR